MQRYITNGFKRDYAVGLTSNDYIFHLDFDTVYNPKVIKHKLDFLNYSLLNSPYYRNFLSKDSVTKKIFYKDEIVGTYEVLAFEDIKKVNIFTRLIKSINYLIWGDV